MTRLRVRPESPIAFPPERPIPLTGIRMQL